MFAEFCNVTLRFVCSSFGTLCSNRRTKRPIRYPECQVRQMKKARISLIALVLVFVVSFFAFYTFVQADNWMNVTFSDNNSITYVNQPVELTVVVSGGTPPYTYQWKTQFVPQVIIVN